MKKVSFALLVTLLMLLGATAAWAANGSIRGTVYIDENNNGKCVGENEPTHPGVPIEFISDDGNFTTFLQTGDNGTYGLVAAGFGTWKVSARPNANDFVVTSTPTLNVFIGEEEPLALNIDFCIRPTNFVDGHDDKKHDPYAAPTGVVLPAAGESANNTPLFTALISGLSLLVIGAAIQFRRTQ